MIDTNKLRGIFAENGKTQADVAKMLGVTPKTFYMHMRKGVFGSDDIQKMIDSFNIENPIDIFFAIGGNRFDHTYSNLLILEYCRQRNVSCRLIDDNNRLSLIIGKRTIKKEYRYFSLFAYLCDCHGVTIEGAYYDQSFYNLDSMDMMAYDNFAQSNRIIGTECTICVEDGVLLLVESND